MRTLPEAVKNGLQKGLESFWLVVIEAGGGKKHYWPTPAKNKDGYSLILKDTEMDEQLEYDSTMICEQTGWRIESSIDLYKGVLVANDSIAEIEIANRELFFKSFATGRTLKNRPVFISLGFIPEGQSPTVVIEQEMLRKFTGTIEECKDFGGKLVLVCNERQNVDVKSELGVKHQQLHAQHGETLRQGYKINDIEIQRAILLWGYEHRYERYFEISEIQDLKEISDLQKSYNVDLLVGKNLIKYEDESGTLLSMTTKGFSLLERRENFERQFALEQKSRNDVKLGVDTSRDFDAFVMSAKGETRTKSFQEWAGGERVTLAIVFTDVVGSTALGEEIRDEAMNEVRRTHFAQSRKLIDQFQGREIKTIGDSFMAAFKSADAALDYALALEQNTGHPQVQIRVGIHIGSMQVEEGDVFGGTVNFAARVIGAIKGAEIWLSDQAKEDIDRLGSNKHKHLKWQRQEGILMIGFLGVFTLWSLH
jgi:class 3 adenylate cyclase